MYNIFFFKSVKKIWAKLNRKQLLETVSCNPQNVWDERWVLDMLYDMKKIVISNSNVYKANKVIQMAW